MNTLGTPTSAPIRVVLVAILSGLAACWSCDARSAHPAAAADLGGIEGEWLALDAFDRFVERRDEDNLGIPIARLDGLIIGRDAGSFRVRMTGFHETSDFEAATARVDAEGDWHLDDADGAQTLRLHAFEPEASGTAWNIRATLLPQKRVLDYRRVPEGIEAFVNRHTVEGDWGSRAGTRRYIFRADGSAHWNGLEARYRLALASSGATCGDMTVSHWPHGLAQQQRIGYRRKSDSLFLYEIMNDTRTTTASIHCTGTPFASLRARNPPSSGMRWERLHLLAGYAAAIPTYAATRGDWTIAFERVPAPLSGNDFGEADAQLAHKGGTRCTIAQDGWFDRRAWWVSSDLRFLAATKRSADAADFVIVRTSDCAELARVNLDAAKPILDRNRLLTDGSCEAMDQDRWFCVPAKVWQIEPDGQLHYDATASDARTEAVFGMRFRQPREIQPGMPATEAGS